MSSISLPLNHSGEPLNPLEICTFRTTRGGEIDDPTQAVLSQITATLTPEEFDTLVLQHPGFSLRDTGQECSHALVVAILKGNFRLVRHIAQLDPTLVNLGNHWAGIPPLSYVVQATNKHNGVQEDVAVAMALCLLQHGAAVNLCSRYDCPILYDAL